MATGLLNLAPQPNEVASYDPAKAAASKPTTVGYDPSQFSVQPKATVAQQFQDLSSMDSPLLKQARARATRDVGQKMNQRGLLNSSLAMGAVTEAADQAVYDKILPIAQQDATTYFTADTNTTNADNAAKYAKMQADNTASLRGAELDTNVSLANADAMNKQGAQAAEAASRVQLTGMETSRALQLADKEFQRAMGTAQLDATTRLQLAEMDQATRLDLANVDRNTRVELATIENNYRQLLQTNQDIASMYNQVSTNISNIAASNLSANAKADATQTQLNLLKQALAAKQAVAGTPATTGTTPSGPSSPNLQNLNISSYFQNDNTRGTFDQAAYDRAMATYRQQVAARDASWAAWDRGGRSGPWNVPAPTPPNRDNFYGAAPTTPAPTSAGTINTGAGSPNPTQPTSPTQPTKPTGTAAPPKPTPSTSAIPSWGQAAPQYGAGAYTYASGGRTMLHVPGKGDRPL